MESASQIALTLAVVAACAGVFLAVKAWHERSRYRYRRGGEMIAGTAAVAALGVAWLIFGPVLIAL